MTYIVADSGERQNYKSGMRRDLQKGKIRYDLVDQAMLKRWAQQMTLGAEKYGVRNWQLADSEEELDRFRASAYRHFYQWFNGEGTEEDHASAVFFNISSAEYVKNKLNENGKTKT